MALLCLHKGIITCYYIMCHQLTAIITAGECTRTRSVSTNRDAINREKMHTTRDTAINGHRDKAHTNPELSSTFGWYIRFTKPMLGDLYG